MNDKEKEFINELFNLPYEKAKELIDSMKGMTINPKLPGERHEDDENKYSLKESLEHSLREMKLMREGEMEKPNWRETIEKIRGESNKK